MIQSANGGFFATAGAYLSIERDRLVSLLDFAYESARLKTKPAATVAGHGIFSLYEDETRGLPGVTVNRIDAASRDEIWLAIERLHETAPPEVTAAFIQPWISVPQDPTEQPTLRQATDGASLIAAGTHCPTSAPERGKAPIEPTAAIRLNDYDKADQVRAQMATYADTKWRPWAEEEKHRRKTIRHYSQLFKLKHQLDGGIIETPIELVWGVGLGIWRSDNGTVNYPLLLRLVELSLNPETGELEIRPRGTDGTLEIDWFASTGNPGVGKLKKAADEFFAQVTVTLSPFDHGSFEPVLRAAAANLDANGRYWPDEVRPDDRTPPSADDRLKVTDTWVLFARPRTNNVLLRDLQELKKQAEGRERYPPAVAAIVTDPDATGPVLELPSFRGVSASGATDLCAGALKPRDLYFPKPFNDEQVRIVQLLDTSDGVVVQGPPGTGKTHTIANVICHYLAEGKRVLVTSMKDPALAVLREQLPAEIRPLAISLLTSEQDGTKQFEHAIQKIASEVQALDPAGTKRAIALLEESIDNLHSKLAGIDHRISDWAKKNLTRIVLDTEQIEPQHAAREVVDNAGEFEWIPDALGIGPEFAPQFSDADIVRLREARGTLGADIDYLDASVPEVLELPDPKRLLETHRDLSLFSRLKASLERGEIADLADSSEETIAMARHLLTRIGDLKRAREKIPPADQPWTTALRMRLTLPRAGDDDLYRLLDTIGADLKDALERRKEYLARPVAAAAGAEIDPDVSTGLANLARGRRPFGVKGIVGKTQQKRHIAGIRVLGAFPIDREAWKHVAEYLSFLRRLREMALRWNALARELPLGDTLGDKPEDGLSAAQNYGLYLTVREIVAKEEEVCTLASRVFPAWPGARQVGDDLAALAELEKALGHHITLNRLVIAWAEKERFGNLLNGRSGRVVADLRAFFADTIGNPAVGEVAMLARWSALVAELTRVVGLSGKLADVREVCDIIEASGAPQYAALLKLPFTGTIDTLLPGSWRKAWRLRRLAAHLDALDAEDKLKSLSKDRREIESSLSRAYHDTVVKRTWLKLAESASRPVRAALQAFLNAIQKIGGGTGVRAVRYRNDARMAASAANPAVPCWIMAHYRVSESLPAELGVFDLVVIDEASQSDLSALPCLLRANKALIVGDDKQVSPEGVGVEEKKVVGLMERFLRNQVPIYRAQMSPDSSIYDLFKVVFAQSAVMLKEHFRCVAPIIEYSKREFYNHELRPLRLPKASERLDPPLIDVLMEDGYRSGDVNLPEARFIVNEIKRIAADPSMCGRSIGVVSLLADKQAMKIWELLTDELGPEEMQRRHVACGDARTFQGKERDIMFLSMIAARNEVGAPLSRGTFAQRFNVAASRARDRMYLVRSVELEHLSGADTWRRSLIGHFAAPFAQDEVRVAEQRMLCESPFEGEMYDELTVRGYRVIPQVRAGVYRIDMVVEGNGDARLAIECDGDKYHGLERWAEDMQRQRVLERAGWVFWRCFASAFVRRRKEVLKDLLDLLAARGIEPIGAEGAPTCIHTEHRVVSSSALQPARQGASPAAAAGGEAPPGNAGQTEPTPAQETFGWGNGAARMIGDIPDSEIRSAIRNAVRAYPNEDELAHAVEQALRIPHGSDLARARILRVLNEELSAKRIRKSTDLTFF